MYSYIMHILFALLGIAFDDCVRMRVCACACACVCEYEHTTVTIPMCS